MQNVPVGNTLGIATVYSKRGEAGSSDESTYVFGRDTTSGNTVTTLQLDDEVDISSDFTRNGEPLTIADLNAGVEVVFGTVDKDAYISTKLYPVSTDPDDDYAPNWKHYRTYDVGFYGSPKHIRYIALHKDWNVNGVVATDFEMEGIQKVVTADRVWLLGNADMVGSRLITISHSEPIVFTAGELNNSEYSYGNTVTFRVFNPEAEDKTHHVLST